MTEQTIDDHPEDPPADAPEEPPKPEGWGEESEEIKGGVQTTDPSFADGAQEVESYSNQPHSEPEAE